MREIPAPSFKLQADTILNRIDAMELSETERRNLNDYLREKHRLLQEEARFLTKLTAWADLVDASVKKRKATEEAQAAHDAYIRTMQELTASISVQVTEILAAEPADPQIEEAA